jgi:hypothetical protein
MEEIERLATVFGCPLIKIYVKERRKGHGFLNRWLGFEKLAHQDWG